MLAALAMAAACAPRPAPPAPAPPPPPEAPPPSAPPAPPPPADWTLAPLSPGDWAYSEGSSSATFRSDTLAFVLRCERSRSMLIGVTGAPSSAVTIRTTYGERRLLANAALPADDPLFDQMAFSRGRLLVEAGGAALVVPAWPEIARVTEDCRSA
jgi:hypothetical protein